MLKVREQIPPVLDAKGDSHKTLADSSFIEVARATSRVSGATRMAGQRLHSAEGDGIPGQLQLTEKIEGSSLATKQIDRNETARIVALFAVDADLLGIFK